MFLRVELPENANKWLSNIGQHIVKSIKIKSGGRTPIFYDDYRLYIQDYLSSLSNEAHAAFTKAYLGGYQAAGAETAGARTVYIPILLPNSHFLHREHRNSKAGSGVLPCNFENNKLEICVSLHPATYPLVDGGTADSLVGNLRWCIREVQMNEANMVRYESARGSFSQITRQFTTVHGDNYRFVESASEEKTEEIIFQRMSGTVTELLVFAVPVSNEAEEVKYLDTQVRPKSVQLWVDSILVREYKTADFLTLELYKQGFIENSVAQTVTRVCFGSHVSSRQFTGGFNMANCSNVRLKVTWPAGQNVKYQVRCSRLENLQIDSTGTLRSSLE